MKCFCVLFALALLLTLQPNMAGQGNDSDLSGIIKTLEQGIEKKNAQEKELYLVALLHIKQYEKGIAVYEKHFAQKKPDFTMQMTYYKLLKGADDKRAVRALGELYGKLPLNPSVLYELGLDFSKRGEFSDIGRTFFEKAIEVDPFFLPPYLEIARWSREPDEILKNCARGLSLVAPDSIEAKELREILTKHKLPAK